MTKLEFTTDLFQALQCLPDDDLAEQVNYYSEMIDDLIEDGLTEEDAVAQLGPVDTIVAQILSDVPMSKLLKRKRRLSGTEIALLALGAPLWLPLLIAAFSVVLSVYVSLWVIIISLWSGFVALAACGLGGIFGGIYFAFTGYGLTGLAVIGLALASTGLSVFAFYGCRLLTKTFLHLTKGTWLWVKMRLIRKEKGV